jgi:hypothetical protein
MQFWIYLIPQQSLLHQLHKNLVTKQFLVEKRLESHYQDVGLTAEQELVECGFEQELVECGFEQELVECGFEQDFADESEAVRWERFCWLGCAVDSPDNSSGLT